MMFHLIFSICLSVSILNHLVLLKSFPKDVSAIICYADAIVEWTFLPLTYVSVDLKEQWLILNQLACSSVLFSEVVSARAYVA